MKYLLIILALIVSGCSGGGGGSEPSKKKEVNPVIFESSDKSQDFAFDEVNNKFYTLTDGLITKYSLPDYYLEEQYHTNMGHQGLSVQYGKGLWSSGTSPRSGAINGDNHYILFDDSYSRDTSSTPAISKDQRYLVAFGRKGEDTFIRVWDLDAPINEYSYITEFNAGRVVYKPMYGQGMASDGEYIYLVTGNKASDNLLYKWDMEGELISKKKLPYEGEPEGLDFYKDSLIVGIWSDTFKLYNSASAVQ